MALIIVFIFGVANFAMHKAVLESGHPMLAQLPSFFRSPGGRISLIVEFLLLLGTMLLVSDGAGHWAWGYGAYSAMNALSAWLILTRRI
ncbi:hypothetical protein [Novosphingobium sp. TH158]|uniref:hypothetical protein n=1 Tax=Novosphingobium sp. TH158 TaxID=2067455 RepID=UPI000C7D3A82|nr:hypothetical protein [Novosphingobium sp. TH158]PLK27237.1 hypothetical protein C0V78_10320 [Novosphingobium sp. TH158]